MIRTNALDACATTVSFFSGKLDLWVGTIHPAFDEEVVAPMRHGLKIVVMLEGAQSIALDDGPAIALVGPSVLVSTNTSDHTQKRSIAAGTLLRCVLIQIDAAFAASEFSLSLPGSADEGDMPVLWINPVDPHIDTIALQLMTIDPRSEAFRIEMLARTLELVAAAVHRFGGLAANGPALMSARTLRQVYLARDAIMRSLSAPPSLVELAKTAGINRAKLTAGFRKVFGKTVHEYVQEQRLQTAMEAIKSKGVSVAEAAYQVGYNPAHLSSLFRQRFGRPPSAFASKDQKGE